VPGRKRASRDGCDGIDDAPPDAGAAAVGVRLGALVSVASPGADVTAAPHELQKRLSGGTRLEHDGHWIIRQA
jgi:hypothetical protein